MVMIAIKYLTISLILVFHLVGCMPPDEYNNAEIIYRAGYREKQGDVFTKSEAKTFVYSNGETVTSDVEIVEVYTEVEKIPAGYRSSYANQGPFLLKTTTKNGIVIGLEYLNTYGRIFICDNLEHFSNFEYNTETGSNEPFYLYLGKKYNYSSRSTLFNSKTCKEEGYESINIKTSVVKTESINVSAGTFDAVILEYEAIYEKSLNDKVDTINAKGTIWLDSNSGFTLKETNESEISFQDLDITANGAFASELTHYLITPIDSYKKTPDKELKKQSSFNSKTILKDLKKHSFKF